MKKAIITLVFAIGMIAATFGQTINGKSFNEIDVKFMQIYGKGKLMSPNKLTITLDFGGENKIWSPGDNPVIKDAHGNVIEFKSMIDALNFMNSLGYDFVDSYTLSAGNQNMYHYILRKE